MARSGRQRHPWLPLAAIAALAFIVRIAYLSQLTGSPLLAGLMGDSRQYDAWAHQIAAGQWAGTEIFYQTPLYPYALAIVFTVAGHDLDLVRLIQAILGAASCALLGLAGRRFFSERVGLIAAGLLAIYPAAIFFDGLIQKSSLDIFFVTLLLALIVRIRTQREWKRLVALGVVTAAFILNRENARVLYPVMAAWLWFTSPDVSLRPRIVPVAVFVAASFVVLLPVAVRNYHVGGEFVLTTSQLGPNFYIGNNPHASGTYEPLVAGHGDPVFERNDATRLASQSAGRALSPTEVSNYWLAQAFAYIRSQPVHWIALLGKKLLLTFNAAELPDTESMRAYADYSPILRALLWMNLGVLLPLAALGAAAHRAEWRQLLILYAIVATFALTVASFYVVDRYRHPLAPIVLLFAAAGMNALADQRLGRRQRALPVPKSPRPASPSSRGLKTPAYRHKSETPADRHKPETPAERPKSETPAERPKSETPAYRPKAERPPLLPALVAGGLVAVVANLPMEVARDETYVNLGVVLAAGGRPADAIPVLLKAVSLDPEHGEAHFRLGLAYQDAGQPRAAIDELRTAVRLRPDHGEAHNALGVMLQKQDGTADALPHFREAVRHAPDSVEAHTNLGIALMEAGELDEAMAEHRRAIALAPDSARPHNNLAMALASAREFEMAFRHFREAIRLQPGNADVRLAFGSALCEAGKISEGIDQYNVAARLAPDSVDPPYLSAQAYARAGRIPEAVASLEKALAVANATGRTDVAPRISDALRQLEQSRAR